MKKTLVIFISLFIFLFGITNVSAGTVTISSNATSVYVGATVVVTVKAPDVAGKFSITSSNTSILSGGSSSSWIENTVTFTFQANSVGTATITVKPIDAADYSGNVYSTTKTITISVIEKKVVVLSSNNALSSLGIDGVSLSPEFNADTLNYTVSLNPDTTTINVTGTASDSGATIFGLGERNVSDGENSVDVVVTAENGETRTYNLKVTVTEYDPITVEIDKKSYTIIRKRSKLIAPENYSESTLTINDVEVPSYISDITKYTLVGLKDSDGNQKLYIYDNGEYTLYQEASFNKIRLQTLKVENKNLIEGYNKVNISYGDLTLIGYKKNETDKYALFYAMNLDTGLTNWYMFEPTEGTVQIYNSNDLESLNILNDNYFKYIIIISSIAIALFLGYIIIIIKEIINKRKSKPVGKHVLKEDKE
ncbi:MAG: cadherin-like beta sandwich domain-containing protein [Bacilli bacterium]